MCQFAVYFCYINDSLISPSTKANGKHFDTTEARNEKGIVQELVSVCVDL